MLKEKIKELLNILHNNSTVASIHIVGLVNDIASLVPDEVEEVEEEINLTELPHNNDMYRQAFQYLKDNDIKVKGIHFMKHDKLIGIAVGNGFTY